METQAAPRARLHPLVATAAVAVTIASAVGIAALTGLVPTGTAKQAEHALVAQAPAAAPMGAPTPAVSRVAPQPVEIAAPEAAPVAKPVVRAAPKPKPVMQQNAPVHREPVQVAQAGVPPREMYPPVSPDYRPVQAQAPAPVAAPRQVCFDCGIVESMREVDTKGEGTGLGAVAGGIGGLILGKQIGNGKGSKIASVLGAAGGAYAGHQIEKSTRSTKTYEVGVRMEDGTYRTIPMASQPTWRSGDHVRIVDGGLQSSTR